MPLSLVQSCEIPAEDEKFFGELIAGTEQFWRGAKPLNQTEADFNAQPFPQENVMVAGSGFRRLADLPKVARALETFNENKGFVKSTNSVVYNPMSFMRWHTNSNAPGIRHYFTYTTGRAIFRWRHPRTGQIFDEVDNSGWTYRTFFISPTELVWHTIWTESVRLSFGFTSTTT